MRLEKVRRRMRLGEKEEVGDGDGKEKEMNEMGMEGGGKKG